MLPRRPRRPLPNSLLLGLFLASALAGCELIADFESDELEGRTVPVRPLPVLDGSMPPRMPDGSVRDGALVTDRPVADGGSGDASTSVVVPPMDAGG